MHLHVAQSRVSKAYVQDKLTENGEGIAKLLLSADNAHFYICGDARMAQSCNVACVEVLQKFGGMSRIAALHHMMKMRVENRWQLDVWGNAHIPVEENSFHKSTTQKVQEIMIGRFRESLSPL